MSAVKSTPKPMEKQPSLSPDERAEIRRRVEAELRRFAEQEAKPDGLDAGLSLATRQVIAGEVRGDSARAVIALAILELVDASKNTDGYAPGFARFVLCFAAASAGISSGWLTKAVEAVVGWHEAEMEAGRTPEIRMIPAALDHLWREPKSGQSKSRRSRLEASYASEAVVQ